MNKFARYNVYFLAGMLFGTTIGTVTSFVVLTALPEKPQTVDMLGIQTCLQEKLDDRTD